MDFVDALMDWRVTRIVGPLVLLWIYYREYQGQSLPAVVGAVLVLLVYSVMFWTPKTWWNQAKYLVATILILAMAMTLHYEYGVADLSLLWPLVYLLATVYGKYGRLSTLLGSLTIFVMVLMSYTNLFPFETIIALVGLFIGVRSRRMRQDAYHLRRQHLEQLNDAHRELQQAHAELQEATVHSMRYAALEERTRLAREIHDGLGHQLTSLIVQLQALDIMLPDDPQRASENVSQLLQISRQAMAEVRMAVREWADDEMGLGLVALKGLVTQTQGRSAIPIHFVQGSEISEWPIETSVLLYRVLQESLTNVLRHSQATSVEVRVEEREQHIVLMVADDGQYTEEQPLTPGFGLKGIMERCRAHGGTCTFSPVQPHGLRIEVKLPIDPETYARVE